jgi:hypothetical protein
MLIDGSMLRWSLPSRRVALILPPILLSFNTSRWLPAQSPLGYDCVHMHGVMPHTSGALLVIGNE